MQIREVITEFHFDCQVRKLSPKTIALYPHFNEIPVLDTNCRIVAPRVTLLPEDLEPLKISA